MLKKDEIFLEKNWGNIHITEIQKNIDYDLYTILDTALKLKLQNISTAHLHATDTRRKWTKEEEVFLTTYSFEIRLDQASNLLHRSRYATYQRVRVLGLHEMINNRRR